MVNSKIVGVVLCGGDSRRMGRDKGSLTYHGTPQARRAYEMLRSLLGEACVAVRRDQTSLEPYGGLPCVLDVEDVRGPAAGVLGAWSAYGEVALLALAVDMPRVDASLLTALLNARDPASLATAFVHPDGTPEPLCTLWESRAHALIQGRAELGRFSLRRVLETGSATLLEAADPTRLSSIDTPGEYARALAARTS